MLKTEMNETVEIINGHFPNHDDVSGLSATNAKEALVKVVQDDGLGALTRSALQFRKEGRIDRSIQLITKANRFQLDAIEAIQQTFDELAARPTSKVVFAKYRQLYPFEMGIENGGDVLQLLCEFKAEFGADHSEQIERLHQLESEKASEEERLDFFESRYSDGSEKSNIDAARAAVQLLTKNIDEIKLRTLSVVLAAVDRVVASPGRTDIDLVAKCELSKWLFVLATSPTQTRHAKYVKTEA